MSEGKQQGADRGGEREPAWREGAAEGRPQDAREARRVAQAATEVAARRAPGMRERTRWGGASRSVARRWGGSAPGGKREPARRSGRQVAWARERQAV